MQFGICIGLYGKKIARSKSSWKHPFQLPSFPKTCYNEIQVFGIIFKIVKSAVIVNILKTGRYLTEELSKYLNKSMFIFKRLKFTDVDFIFGVV